MSSIFLLDAPVDIYGAFWRPNEPDETFTGRLSRDGKFLRLVSSPAYKQTLSLPEDFLLMGQGKNIEILHGFTSEGPCTLLWAQFVNQAGMTDFRVDKSLTYREYRVGLCLIGLHSPAPQAKCFSEAMLGFSGLHEWCPAIPNQTKLNTGEWALSYPTRPPIVDFQLPSTNTRLCLDIISRLQRRSSGEVHSRNRSQLLVAPEQPQNIKWYLEIANRFANLFSLLLGTSVRLEYVQLKQDSNIGAVLRADKFKSQATDASVWVKCNALQLETAISQWLTQPEDFGSLEGLVYGTIRHSSLFVETEFLSLAQALESFHRITTGKRTTFAQRVKSLLSSMTPEHRKQLIGDDQSRFVDILRDTRNHFTHLGSQKKGTVLTGTSELFLFNQKLHALLRFSLLMHIGLPEDHVFQQILREARRYAIL